MANLTRWSPRELLSPFEDAQEEMDRMLNSLLGLAPMRAEIDEGCWYPAVDLEEEADHYALIAELPGIDKDEVKVTFSDGTLILSGERKPLHEEKRSGFHRHERCYGKFQRSFALPSQIDSSKINASFKNGVLEIDIPKSAEAQPKQVDISVR